MVSFEEAVTKQLCDIRSELQKIRALSEIQESRDVGVVYIAIPESAGTRSFAAGKTKINFLSGVITNPDNSTEQLQVSLQRLGKDFLHSLSMSSDQDIIIQIGTQNKRTLQANLGLEAPYLTYNEITITTTTTTNISIYASTNPFSTVNGNTVSIMKGQYSGNLVTVAVDADGNILGVLKGDYGGSLKTLATDDQGRLLAKIYDPNDVFGQSYAIGLGELGARLDGWMSYDRRGQFLWGDDFESFTPKWVLSSGNGGNTPELVSTRAWNGDLSMHLSNTVSAGSYSMMTKSIQSMSNARVGFEFKMNLGAYSNSIIDVWLSFLNGTTRYYGQLTFWPGLRSFGIFKSGGTLVQLESGYPFISNASHWVAVKLVVDFGTLKFVRVLVGSKTYDVSGYSLQQYGEVVTEHIEPSIELFGSDIGATDIYIDGVVITVNEP